MDIRLIVHPVRRYSAGVANTPHSWADYKIMQFFTRNWVYTPNFGLKIRIFLRFASPFVKTLKFTPPFSKVCIWAWSVHPSIHQCLCIYQAVYLKLMWGKLVAEKTMIRNWYNQIPHPTTDNKRESNTRLMNNSIKYKTEPAESSLPVDGRKAVLNEANKKMTTNRRYHKFPKYRTPKKFVVITLKFELCGSTLE